MSAINSQVRTLGLGLVLILLAVVGVMPVLAQGGIPASNGTGKIAFSKGSQIYVMNIDGTNATNLTNDGDTNLYPSMSPDGNWIAYTSNNGLYIMKADGSNPDGTQNPLPLITSNIYSPRLSAPDVNGNITVVFIRNGASSGQKIWTLKVNSMGLLIPGSEQQVIPASTNNDTSPCISPDGTTVAFVRGTSMNDGEIYTYNLNTKILTQITTLGSTVRSWHPSFSPDGNKIVFYSNVGFNTQTGTPAVGTIISTNQTYIYDTTTRQLTHVEQVADFTKNDRVPSFTPDGDRLVFVDYSDKTLWMMSTTGTNRVLISPKGFTNVSDPDCGTGIVPTPPPLPPVLTSPKNQTTGVPASPLTLSWGTAEGGAHVSGYIVQYSTVADFTVNPRTILGITGTSTVINTSQYPLLPGQTYYWRVKAINTSAISGTQYSVWPAPFSFTMVAAPPPSAPVLSSPANSAIDVALLPTFTWQTVPTATKYSLQVSTSDTFATIAAQANDVTALSYKLTSALQGKTKYFWRVRGVNGDINGDGGIGAWSAPFSFTTIVPPVAPVLLNPTANATGIAVPSFTFSWIQVAGATSYLLSITNTDTQTTVLTNQSVTGTSYLYNGLVANTGYSWSVTAANGAGSGAAAVGIFHTVTPPVAPTLVSPIAPQNTNIILPPVLRWTNVTGATSYKIEVSTSSQFATLVAGYPVATASISYTAGNLANGTTYYWRVSSVNNLGAGAPAVAASFTTVAAAPSVPVLSSPANLVTINNTSVTLMWGAVSGTGIKYWLQVGTDTGFSSTTLIANYDSLTTTSLQLNSLQPWRTYYWRVLSRGAAGNSAWSTVWSFTITSSSGTGVGTINAPNLLLPANNAKLTATGPVTFQWSAVTNVKSYSLQVALATDANFVRPVVNTESVTPTGAGGGTITISGLLPNTSYIWRVKSLSQQNATSGWSSPLFTFTTAPTPTVTPTVPPTQPTITAPLYNANAPQPFNLQWVVGANGGAPTAYILQLSQYVDMHSAVIDNKMVTVSSYQLSGLVKGVRYWWHVKAINAAGISSWSSLSTFIAL